MNQMRRGSEFTEATPAEAPDAGRQRLENDIKRFAKVLGKKVYLCEETEEYEPVTKGMKYVLSPEQNEALTERYGDNAAEVLHERITALIDVLTGRAKEKVMIPVSFMQREILGALPKYSELAFRVMGSLDNEGNLHVSPHGVKWERR